MTVELYKYAFQHIHDLQRWYFDNLGIRLSMTNVIGLCIAETKIIPSTLLRSMRGLDIKNPTLVSASISLPSHIAERFDKSCRELGSSILGKAELLTAMIIFKALITCHKSVEVPHEFYVHYKEGRRSEYVEYDGENLEIGYKRYDSPEKLLKPLTKEDNELLKKWGIKLPH